VSNETKRLRTQQSTMYTCAASSFRVDKEITCRLLQSSLKVRILTARFLQGSVAVLFVFYVYLFAVADITLC